MQRVYKKSSLRHRLVAYVVLLSFFLQSCLNEPIGGIKRKRAEMETENGEKGMVPKELELEQTRLGQTKQTTKQATKILSSLSEVKALYPDLEEAKDHKRLEVKPGITKPIITKSLISNVDRERPQSFNKQSLDSFKMSGLPLCKRRKRRIDPGSLFPLKRVKEVRGKDDQELKSNSFKEAKRYKQELCEAKFVPFVINPNAEYDENMILMVWDSFLKNQGDIRYFVGNENYIQTFFNKDGNGMAPQRLAALLVKGTINELYLNDNNKSVSICGVVNYETGVSENLILMNLEEAIDQIKIWNNHQAVKRQKITNHLIVFPYHVASNHWALGVLALNLDEQGVLRNAQIQVFNPLPKYGGNQVSNMVYFCIQALLQSAFPTSKIELIAKDSKHKKQQNDKASCGVITAENGKFFLSSSSVRNRQLMQTYPWGAKQLRRKHLKEVDRNDFYQAQFVKPCEIPQFCKPSNYQDLQRGFMQGITTLNQDAKKRILCLVAKINKEEEINIAIQVKDFIKAYQDNFQSILSLFDIQGSDWKFKEDHINTLIYILNDYYQLLVKEESNWKNKENISSSFSTTANQIQKIDMPSISDISDQSFIGFYAELEKQKLKPIAFCKRLLAQQGVENIQKAADQGYAGAQYVLGLMFANKLVVEKDEHKAVAWFQKAAVQGYANAQFALAVMSANGRGCEKDERRAIAWYRSAAKQGHAAAQNDLGIIYANGIGVDQDDSEAVTWFRKAAMQGYARAQFALGVMYAKGRGIQKDEGKSRTWYQKAAAQGYAKAQLALE